MNAYRYILLSALFLSLGAVHAIAQKEPEKGTKKKLKPSLAPINYDSPSSSDKCARPLRQLSPKYHPIKWQQKLTPKGGSLTDLLDQTDNPAAYSRSLDDLTPPLQQIVEEDDEEKRAERFQQWLQLTNRYLLSSRLREQLSPGKLTAKGALDAIAKEEAKLKAQLTQSLKGLKKSYDPKQHNVVVPREVEARFITEVEKTLGGRLSDFERFTAYHLRWQGFVSGDAARVLWALDQISEK